MNESGENDFFNNDSWLEINCLPAQELGLNFPVMYVEIRPLETRNKTDNQFTKDIFEKQKDSLDV